MKASNVLWERKALFHRRGEAWRQIKAWIVELPPEGYMTGLRVELMRDQGISANKDLDGRTYRGRSQP